MTQEEKNNVVRALTSSGANPVIVEKFNSIGPVVGDELRSKAYIAIVLLPVPIDPYKMMLPSS
jgi:preprotein translocase subunit SecF